MSELMNRLIKASPNKYTNVLSKSEIFNVKDTVPTSLPILNIALSGKVTGGITGGAVIWSGESKTFKTLVSLFCMKAYLDKYPEAVAMLFDSEGGVTPDYLTSIGIDTSRVIHIPIEHLEMLKFDMVKALKEIKRGDKVFMMVDSIGMTASLKELDDAENEKTVADMQRAKVIKGIFRMVTPMLNARDIPAHFIAHVYKEMTLYPKTIVSGGNSLMYSANQVFIITKSQEKDAEGLAGWNFTINVEKSRYVKEKSKLQFTVKFKGGIARWSGLLDLAAESGHVTKTRRKGYVYNRVNVETGEVDPQEFTETQTNTKDFWLPILKDKSFQDFVDNKFSVSNAIHLAEDDETAIPEDDEDLDLTEV